MNKIKNSSQGFTLLELLVVVLIIGILAGIALPQYKKAVYKAKFIQATLMIDNIYKAQQEYYAFHGQYAVDFPSLNMDLPPTNGTPTNYAYWDWGYCFIIANDSQNAYYGGCGNTKLGVRKLTWWSSKYSLCYANKNNATSQEICQAVTGKTAEQRTSVGNDYVYNF